MSPGIRKFIVFAIALVVSWIVGINVAPTWTVEQIALDARSDSDGRLYYIYRNKRPTSKRSPSRTRASTPGEWKARARPRW